ncbi:hypothetical protein R6Q57_018216 [Mikania cordata]
MTSEPGIGRCRRLWTPLEIRGGLGRGFTVEQLSESRWSLAATPACSMPLMWLEGKRDGPKWWEMMAMMVVAVVVDSRDGVAAGVDQPSKDDSSNDKDKRKKEVEEKLQILNERKHKLVQVLKQILNAEEELRRRSNVQGITGRPSVSLQVDVTNDSGSMSRHATPRPGSEAADMGGADADDASNHNMHSRNMMRMSSMSPSSDSLLRRAHFSMVPNPSRGVVTSSPSRFAPTWNGQQQQHGGNLPSVSVTGTNYVASSPSPSPSPSPAGSGGTSVFRDAIASPWN